MCYLQYCSPEAKSDKASVDKVEDMGRPLEALGCEQSWRSSGWDTVSQVKFPWGCMVAGISMIPEVFGNLMCKCFVRMLMETVGANSSTEDPRSPTDSR